MAPSSPPVSPHSGQYSQTHRAHTTSTTIAQHTTATAHRPDIATYAPRMRTIPLPLASDSDNAQHHALHRLLTPPPSPENRRTYSLDDAQSSMRSYYNINQTDALAVDVNALLSGSRPSVVFDVRSKPSASLSVSIPLLRYPYLLQQSVSSLNVDTVSIVSPDLLWTIRVRSTTNSAVTWSDVFTELHRALNEPLQDSEWGLAKDERRALMERSMNQRVGGAVQGDIIRRVDWLGEKTIFTGLVKDDEFVANRSLPGQDLEGDVWVAKFSTRPDI